MIKKIVTILFIAASVMILPLSSHSQDRQIRIIKVQATINPTIAEFITSSIKKAASSGDEAIVIELDTPGGLDTAMRDIIKELLSPPLPVIVYVHPSGGRAASAGVLITMAANISAMTPGTNIGAAHPVNIGGGEISKEMNEKITNDAVAYIKGLAEKRGRNVEWAEKAVKESASIPAEEAFKLNVIDMLAKDLDDLLNQLDGRKVTTNKGETTLSTKGVKVIRDDMGFGRKILNVISDPNVAYILMMLGLLGIYFELANPGALLPGVLGAICLILAFYAFQTIPVNYAGVFLILLAIILFVAEAMVTSYGILAIGGIVAMFLGSIMLFDSPLPYLRASLLVIIPTVLTTAGLFILAITFAVRAQFRKTETGAEGMIGQIGEARSRISPTGKAFVAGEYWDAESEEVIEEGEKVKVIALKGLKIKVSKVAK
ncbi:MAG: nodulation protein NfeD [Deltaproteobacteria bacterium]|nr:nodulation protein NfeD [Deltaproteobacteria bacterium]